MKRILVENIFDELYKQTFNEAYGYILAKTGDPIVSLDVLKKSYTDLFNFLLKQKKDNIKNKRIHLFKIIQNNLIADKETSQPIDDKSNITDDIFSSLQQELDIEISQPKTQEELEAMLDELLNLIAKQPEALRRAFILYFLFDFKTSQVASELCISEKEAEKYILDLTKQVRSLFSPITEEQPEETK